MNSQLKIDNELAIASRSNNAKLFLEWFTIEDFVGLLVKRNVIITIGIPEFTLSYSISKFDCCKYHDNGGYREINYSLGENEFAKYIVPRITELLNEEGL